ncbi:fibronectin type III-like domain-containing protein [Sarocladium implicatum]|nr:fibronectin type III-like domain-containing protein [Sarocladium implicatum]
MDLSSEGLLKHAGRASLDSVASDIDATDYLNDDQQPGRTNKAGTTDRNAGQPSWVAPKPRRNRCMWISIITGAVVLLLAAAGGFGWKKIKTAPPDGLSPPWYPSPKGGSVKQWADSYKKAATMVANMTLPEKVNITTGTGWSMGLAVGNTGPAVNVGFPGLALQDGPLGIRFADHATAFPAGITVGATWNRRLMYERGKAHGFESRLKGINVLLAPCVGPLGRLPAGGRNWEGFGPDPYLQGVAGFETVKGIQDQGVMATIKHFVGNEQEHFRQAWEWGLPNALSSNIDDRTMHEIYAWPFADAVKAGVASVMCSYNMVNSSYACGNSKLLNGILKDEMGFQGFVMSDWLAQRSGIASALAGLDMTMPGDGLMWMDGESLWGPQLTKGVLNGSMPVDRLNDMAVRIVAAWYQLGQDDEDLFDRKGPNFSSWTEDKMGVTAPASGSPQEKIVVNQFIDAQGNHSELARQIAAEGTVLLKNNGILPLKRDGGSVKHDKKLRVGIYGEDAGAGKGPNECPDRGCNQGTLGSGWGSGAVDFPHLIPPVDALRGAFDEDKVDISESLENTIKKLGQLAKPDAQDLCLVFANSDGGEGFIAWKDVKGDRNDLFLQKGGDELILKVAEQCGGGEGSTVVILHAVGPVVMEEWIEHPGIGAVIMANLPGQESGDALVDILFGDVNPSGKLPYTVGKSLDAYGPDAKIMYVPNGLVPQQDFKEGLYIDYRYFDKYDVEPRFEFGYGLTYTEFEYKKISVKQVKDKSTWPAKRPDAGAQPPEFENKIPDAKEALFPSEIRPLDMYIYPYLRSEDEVVSGDYPYPEGYDEPQTPSAAGGGEGGNPDLWETYVRVTFEVKNTGSRDGQAVPQLYMSYPESEGVDFPVRVLRGFEKIDLKKGESKKVSLDLTRRDLSYWDVVKQNWAMVTEGKYVFAIGESSRDLKLKVEW